MEKYFIINQSLNPRKKHAKITVGEKWYNRKTKRNKTIKHVVHIEPLYESYQQWGAVEDVLWFTLPIAEKLVSNNFQTF